MQITWLGEITEKCITFIFLNKTILLNLLDMFRESIHIIS